jgi:hypothetical protein
MPQLSRLSTDAQGKRALALQIFVLDLQFRTWCCPLVLWAFNKKKRPERWCPMGDFISIAFGVAIFVLLIRYVSACEKV